METCQIFLLFGLGRKNDDDILGIFYLAAVSSQFSNNISHLLNLNLSIQIQI